MPSMRTSTLQDLSLGSVLDIFTRGAVPLSAEAAVDQVFGPDRGCLVVSGASGIVGAGKAAQLGSRLEPYGVPLATLDLPGAPNGMAKQAPGLLRAFGEERAGRILAGLTQFTYDGKSLPKALDGLKPKVLLEAIPEILSVKQAHYALFRERFPGIDIHSVTSGFPSARLGVSIAHPAFPHEVNKVFEVVGSDSKFSHLLWALGLIPMRVSDHWSFVLDVLFCGLTNAATRYQRFTNTPAWKVDKLTRRLLGPNPLRAHDTIGAKGANFLTWSCLHHLSEAYGPLFAPCVDLVGRKDSGLDWYPKSHLRPLVAWPSPDEEAFRAWMLGPLVQMTTLLLKEERSHLSQINAIGELCAQFRSGILALIRRMGPDEAIRLVQAYHRLHPGAATSPWHPEVFGRLEGADWQQLYVNAEHDGTLGVITLGRESYNWDVDAELGRAMDWLKAEGIERVILTGDFHLSTQHVGADTSEFHDALEDETGGAELSAAWSRTARRLWQDFRVSVGLLNGKRCMGGMLELMMHCHYLVACGECSVAMPEVTLPVIPGMEGCHWALRRTDAEGRQKLLAMLLTGRGLPASETVGWLVDHAAKLEEAIPVARKLALGEPCGIPRRDLAEGRLQVAWEGSLPAAPHSVEEARRAILACVQASCDAPLAEALEIQARHSAAFMTGDLCGAGVIGGDARKVREG